MFTLLMIITNQVSLSTFNLVEDGEYVHRWESNLAFVWELENSFSISLYECWQFEISAIIFGLRFHPQTLIVPNQWK